MNGITLVGCACFLIASLYSGRPADNEPRRVVVALPPDAKEAGKIRLLLEGVTAPANQPFKLRATTTNSAGQAVFIGSAGVEAVNRNDPKARRLPLIRMDVTRALKRVLANSNVATNAEIVIAAVDGKNNSISNFAWSVEAVRIETQSK